MVCIVLMFLLYFKQTSDKVCTDGENYVAMRMGDLGKRFTTRFHFAKLNSLW